MFKQSYAATDFVGTFCFFFLPTNVSLRARTQPHVFLAGERRHDCPVSGGKFGRGTNNFTHLHEHTDILILYSSISFHLLPLVLPLVLPLALPLVLSSPPPIRNERRWRVGRGIEWWGLLWTG